MPSTMMIKKQIWPDGPFTRADLVGITNPEAALKRALRSGAIRVLLRGVFSRADTPDTIELRARAVAKVTRPHHVATDRTAAWIHGIDVHLYAERDVLPPIEACALRWNAPSEISGIDSRTRDLSPDDVMVVHDVEVTTPMRTALDLGCCLRRREAYAALNSFATAFGFTKADYEVASRRYRRRRGVVQLRELIGLVEPRVESERESWVLLAILDAGLPMPQPQHWVGDAFDVEYRLDFAYPHAQVMVEYNGIDFHERSAEQVESDERRWRWLRDHGWTVIVVRRGDFGPDALARWLSELSDALEPSYRNRRWKY